MGANWCNGECIWCQQHNQCVPAGGSGNQSYKKTFSNTHFDGDSTCHSKYAALKM